MPVKAENKALYPSNWKEIRAGILERAGNKCEKCGIPNRAIGYREKNGDFVQLAASKHECGMEVEHAALDYGRKIIEIVLTIAHVNDSDPGNCEPSNLAAWCQRCHLRHDIDLHKANSAATRAAKRAGIGQTELMLT